MALLRFSLRRLAEAIPLLFGLVTIVFFLSRLLPGDAATVFLSPTISSHVVDQLKEQFGLNRPAVEQYVSWLRSAVVGNLGYSFSQNEPVTHVIARYFPNTALLAGAALIIEIAFGIIIALPVYFASGSTLDRFASRATVVVYTLPSFWIGLLLLSAFSYGLGLFPSSQMYASGTRPGSGSLTDLLHHLILPAATAAIPAAAALGRYLQANIRTVMKQEYVVAATSMGLQRPRIFFSYVFPNAAAPMITLIGVEIGLLLTGALVTETLFAWPGVGRLTVLAIQSRDYPLILGCTLVAGVVVIAGNILSDIANAMLDPRLRLSNAQ
ncbi:MAG: ABC transporter permease [Ignavibacteriae bacterium]|nr:ABC transporter permease [Ignavibacteriota bacterium]